MLFSPIRGVFYSGRCAKPSKCKFCLSSNSALRRKHQFTVNESSRRCVFRRRTVLFAPVVSDKNFTGDTASNAFVAETNVFVYVVESYLSLKTRVPQQSFCRSIRLRGRTMTVPSKRTKTKSRYTILWFMFDRQRHWKSDRGRLSNSPSDGPQSLLSERAVLIPKHDAVESTDNHIISLSIWLQTNDSRCIVRPDF